MLSTPSRSSSHPVYETVYKLWVASGTRRGKATDNYPYAPWTNRQLSLPCPAYSAYGVGKPCGNAGRKHSLSHILYPAFLAAVTDAARRLYTLSTGPITTTTKYINI